MYWTLISVYAVLKLHFRFAVHWVSTEFLFWMDVLQSVVMVSKVSPYKCWGEDKDFKCLPNVIRDKYPCRMRFLGKPWFSSIKRHSYNLHISVRVMVYELSSKSMLPLRFSLRLFEFAASMPVNLSFSCCICCFKIIAFQYHMAFKSFWKNCDPLQHGKDYWALCETWVKNDEIIFYFEKYESIYFAFYYAVTKTKRIWHASLVCPPFASCIHDYLCMQLLTFLQLH